MVFKSISLVVSALVLSTSVHAAVINPILGLNIGGTLYNVTFHDSAGASFNALWDADDDGVFGGGSSLFSTAPTFWGDEAGAQAATSAIITALGTSDASTAGSDSFLIPYQTRGGGTITDGVDTIDIYFDAIATLNQEASATSAVDDFVSSNYNVSPYASFTVVPVPAAAWLFGSGLIGLIGIARRKKV